MLMACWDLTEEDKGTRWEPVGWEDSFAAVLAGLMRGVRRESFLDRERERREMHVEERLHRKDNDNEG